jgi:hypothetical protein
MMSLIVTETVTTSDAHVTEIKEPVDGAMTAINGPVGSAMTGIRRPTARRHPANLRESAAAIAGRHS